MPSSCIFFAASSVGAARLTIIVLKLVPASEPLANNGDIAAMVVVKSSKSTPAVAAIPPPWARARAKSFMVNLLLTVTPVMPSMTVPNSLALNPNCAIASVITSADSAKSEPVAFARATTDNAAPSIISVIDTPLRANISIALAACAVLTVRFGFSDSSEMSAFSGSISSLDLPRTAAMPDNWCSKFMA